MKLKLFENKITTEIIVKVKPEWKQKLCVIAMHTVKLCKIFTVLLYVTRRPASADRTVRAANFRRDLEAT